MSLTKQDLSQIRTIVVDTVNDAIETLISPRFDSLERRMDGLEKRMDALEERMSGLEGRMDGLEGRMDGLEIQQRETNKRLTSLEQQVNNVDGRLKAVENDIKELYLLVTKQDHPYIGAKAYLALTDSKKIQILHGAVTSLAKHVGIKLPAM